jgi:hypothetical protein
MGNIYIFRKQKRFVTKLFQKADLRIAYTTKHTIRRLLTHDTYKNNKYENSGVYQLACLDCDKHYVG